MRNWKRLLRLELVLDKAALLLRVSPAFLRALKRRAFLEAYEKGKRRSVQRYVVSQLLRSDRLLRELYSEELNRN